MIKRPFKDDPCAECRYAEDWDYDDTYTEYRCELDMDESCTGEDVVSQDEMYKR